MPIILDIEKNALDAYHSCFLFNNQMELLVHAMKYECVVAIAKLLGDCMYDALPDWKFDVCTYVPLTQSKLRQRGFNQAELIAKQCCGHDKTTVKNLLSRQYDSTSAQAELNRNDRLQHYQQDTFTVTTNIQELSILLVDDVLTTGATLNSCAMALKTAGAAKVFGLTIAHGS